MKERQHLLLHIMKLTLTGSILIMFLKFTGYYLTHSNAILSDALESIINVVAGAVALFSIHFASLPRDDNHPYGHGKIEFLSSGLEGVLIFLSGFFIIIKSSYHIFYPDDIQKLDIGLLFTIGSGFANFLMGLYLVQKGKKLHSIVIEAEGKHLLSDVYSSLGLALGLVIMYFTQWHSLDNYIAILFSFFLIYTGYQLLRKSIAGLMDEANPILIKKILNVINQNRSDLWIDLHNLRIQNYGIRLHLDAHLVLPYYLSLEESEYEAFKFEKLINDNIPNEVEVSIHLEACVISACQFCAILDCPRRKNPFRELLPWTIPQVTISHAHYIT